MKGTILETCCESCTNLYLENDRLRQKIVNLEDELRKNSSIYRRMLYWVRKMAFEGYSKKIQLLQDKGGRRFGTLEERERITDEDAEARGKYFAARKIWEVASAPVNVRLFTHQEVKQGFLEKPDLPAPEPHGFDYEEFSIRY